MRDEDYHFVDQGAVGDLINACVRLRPYLDAIVCCASTMGEYEPNRIAHDFEKALDEIMVEEADGTFNRYKKVIDND